MKRLSLAAYLMAAFALSACYSVPPPADPVYSDPLFKLHTIQSTSVPENAPAIVAEPLALVVSENAESYISWVRALQAHGASYAMPNIHAVDEAAPEFLVDRWIAFIRKRFPAAELIDDLRTAQERNFKTTLVLDPQVKFGKVTGQTTSVVLTSIVFDSNVRPVSRIVGRGQGTLGWPAFDYKFQPASARALSEFEARLTQIIR
jgi:hypothetical protein